MAKIFYVHQQREDYDYIYFFRNKKNAAAAKVEKDKPMKWQDQEDYDQNKEWGVESITEGSFSYSKGLALFLGDVGDGNYYQEGLEWRDMTEEQFRAQAEKHVEIFDTGKSQGSGALLYYKGAIKEGTEIYMDSRSGIVHDKGTQPTILVEDGEYHVGESVNTTFKYVPTFESFTAPQKVSKTNENWAAKLADYERKGMLDNLQTELKRMAAEMAEEVQTGIELDAAAKAAGEPDYGWEKMAMRIIKDAFKKEKIKL